MSYSTLGILLIIFGIIGFLIKEIGVRRQVRIYTALRNPKRQKDIVNAEKLYRIAAIFASSMLIIIGIWLLHKY